MQTDRSDRRASASAHAFPSVRFVDHLDDVRDLASFLRAAAGIRHDVEARRPLPGGLDDSTAARLIGAIEQIDHEGCIDLHHRLDELARVAGEALVAGREAT